MISVERLFRKGYLRVLIATGTLALGINMPCATVCFIGDDINLTPLNFRQAAGRAGRRGFDLLGNVIFHGLPIERTHRLMRSRLPALAGHFPTSTTLILRLFIMLHGSGNSEYANDVINGLLSQSRLSLGGQSLKEQVLHQVRYSIEYLRRQNLLSEEGEPLSFAPLTSNLHYSEPANFMFQALLRAGIFHDICAGADAVPAGSEARNKAQENASKQLMLIMAHLFGRKQLRKADTDINGISIVPPLPELPANALNVLEAHNKEALQIFSNYVISFAQKYTANTEEVLPFTGTKADPSNPTSSPLPTIPSQTVARSTFVALSGHTDSFASTEDLTTSCRSEIFLGRSGIPFMDFRQTLKLNSYLLEFYINGGTEASIAKACRIRISHVWFLLDDFKKVLITVITSLANLILGKIGDDAAAEDVNWDTLDEEITAETTEAAADDGAEEDSTFLTPAPAPIMKKNASYLDDDDEIEESKEPALGPSYHAERKALIPVYFGFRHLQKVFVERFDKIAATKKVARKVRGAQGVKELKPSLVKR